MTHVLPLHFSSATHTLISKIYAFKFTARDHRGHLMIHAYAAHHRPTIYYSQFQPATNFLILDTLSKVPQNVRQAANGRTEKIRQIRQKSHLDLNHTSSSVGLDETKLQHQLLSGKTLHQQHRTGNMMGRIVRTSPRIPVGLKTTGGAKKSPSDR